MSAVVIPMPGMLDRMSSRSRICLFILQELHALNYTNLEVEAIYPPVYDSNEFIAVLKKA